MKKHFLPLLLMTIASFTGAASLGIYTNPNSFLAGGVSGVSALTHHFLPFISIAAFLVIYNIPLLIWAYKELDKEFVLYSIYGVGLEAVLLSLLETHFPQLVYTDDPLLAAIFGGILMGFSTGLSIKSHGSFGGTDIIGVILSRRYGLSVGSVSICFNFFIIIGAGFVFGFDKAMYTLVNMYASAQTTDKIIEGLSKKRTATIISSCGEEIAAQITQKIHRGITMMKGHGGYSKQEKDVLICVVSRFELQRLKQIVRECDKHAFVTVTDTYDVVGNYFRNMPVLDD